MIEEYSLQGMPPSAAEADVRAMVTRLLDRGLTVYRVEARTAIDPSLLYGTVTFRNPSGGATVTTRLRSDLWVTVDALGNGVTYLFTSMEDHLNMATAYGL